MATTSRARRRGQTRKGGRGKSASNTSNRVGAAWENLNDDGNVANISISLNEDIEINPGDRLVLFPNDYKEQPKHPDYNVVRFND